jgi:hypothetical protein
MTHRGSNPIQPLWRRVRRNIGDAEAVISMIVLKKDTLPIKAGCSYGVMQFSQHLIPANEHPIGRLLGWALAERPLS